VKKLTAALRAELKKPMGTVLAKPTWRGKFVTVGDECSFLAAKAKAKPLLMVYDNRIMRKETCDEKRLAIEGMPGKKLVVVNSAGTITEEAELAISLALGSPPAKIEVDGEEDLLVLPCVARAPLGSAVYYGQPKRGIVKIIVSEATRKRVKKIMLSMEEI
jgi:uncharacterized protein (UPF0218 family)